MSAVTRKKEKTLYPPVITNQYLLNRQESKGHVRSDASGALAARGEVQNRSVAVEAGKPSQRIAGIDALKGAAIILVVFGHAIQSHVRQFDDNLLFRLIYSFHMPLFMMLSGWFAEPERPRKLKKRSIRLVVPVFAWYGVDYFIHFQFRSLSVMQYLKQWAHSPDAGLWFLWVLFLCNLWLALTWKFRARLGVVAYVLGAAVLAALPFSAFGLKLTGYYFPFFLTGFLLSRNWQRCVRFSYAATAGAGIAFATAFPFWHRSMSTIGAVFRIHGHVLNLASPLSILTRYVCGLSGSIVFAFLVALISRGMIQQLLSWLGILTLEIYVVHQEVIHYPGGTGPDYVLASFLCAFSFSWAATWILGKNHVTALLFLGRIPKGFEARMLLPTWFGHAVSNRQLPPADA